MSYIFQSEMYIACRLVGSQNSAARVLEFWITLTGVKSPIFQVVSGEVQLVEVKAVKKASKGSHQRGAKLPAVSPEST